MKELTVTQRKAVRLAREAAVTLTAVYKTDDGELIITAEVEGDSGTYEVTVDPAGRSCTCPHGEHHSPAAQCSHVLATILDYEYTKEEQ